MSDQQYIELPLDAIVVSPVRPPRVMVDAMRNGQWVGQMGIIIPRPDGCYELLCGRRRVNAAKEAGLTRGVFAIAKDVDIAVVRLCENACRSDNPAAAYRDVKMLLDAGWSYADISRKTGINHKKLFKLMKLQSLVPGLMQRLEAGEISAAFAFAAAQLPTEDQEQLATHPKPRISQVRAMRTARLRVIAQSSGHLSPSLYPSDDDNAGSEQLQSEPSPSADVWRAIQQLAMDVRDGLESPDRLIDMILGDTHHHGPMI